MTIGCMWCMWKNAKHICATRQNAQISAGNRTQSPFPRATVRDIYLIFVLKWTLTFAHFCAILRHCNVKYRFRFLRTTIMIEFSKLLYNLFSDLFQPSFDSFLSFFILFQLFFAALKQVISTIIRMIHHGSYSPGSFPFRPFFRLLPTDFLCGESVDVFPSEDHRCDPFFTKR